MKYQSVDENCADSSTAQPTARTTLPVARPAWSGTEAWRCCCWSSQWFDGCLEVQPRLEEAPTIMGKKGTSTWKEYAQHSKNIFDHHLSIFIGLRFGQQIWSPEFQDTTLGACRFQFISTFQQFQQFIFWKLLETTSPYKWKHVLLKPTSSP